MSDSAVATTPETPAESQWSLEAFLSDPGTQPPEFLIRGIFPERSITLLTAQPGSGKSMLAMAMLLCIARGQEFAGFAVNEAPVLFIGEDSASWDYAQIARKFLRGEAAPKNFFARINRRFSLERPELLSEVKDFALAHGIKGIVVDSLRFVHQRDENKSDEMQRVMNAVRNIAEATGAGVLLIHHPPKPLFTGGGSDIRGSSVILASCDFHLNLTSKRLPKERARDLSVTFEKGRCADTPDQLQLLMSWTEDSATVESHEVSCFVVEVLLKSGDAKVADLAKSLSEEWGKSESTCRKAVDRALKLLEEAGTVAKRGDKKNGYIYAIAPSRN